MPKLRAQPRIQGLQYWPLMHASAYLSVPLSEPCQVWNLIRFTLSRGFWKEDFSFRPLESFGLHVNAFRETWAVTRTAQLPTVLRGLKDWLQGRLFNSLSSRPQPPKCPNSAVPCGSSVAHETLRRPISEVFRNFGGLRLQEIKLPRRAASANQFQCEKQKPLKRTTNICLDPTSM